MSRDGVRPEDFDDASVEPGVWRYARASRVKVVVDGEDYFSLVQQAMLKARQRILLIGWDFDTRIHLSQGRRWYQAAWNRDYPARLGSFILWLSNNRPQLEVNILKWSYGLFSLLVRGTMLIDLLRWAPRRRITFKFDTEHPIGCSHHQKIVLIDDDFAVCGGIDMTGARWDTRDHLSTDERRKKPDGTDYGPWHDVSMMLEGDIAGALDELGRERWVRAGGKPLAPPQPDPGSAWPDGLEPDFENVEIGLARTQPAHNGEPKVNEVEDLFVSQIAAAKKFVYAENQYFASRAICEAIANRLAEPNPPEFIIINPDTAHGWLEAFAMDPARVELVSAIRTLDDDDLFHLLVPYTDETPVYVHAKLLIVDDRVLRIGSANFNNRSMGLDTECDAFIDASRPGNDHAEDGIRRLRHSLLAEHCGLEESEVGPLLDRHGSMATMIEAIGRRNRQHLRPFHPAESSEFASDMALRETFDPEEPHHVFDILSHGRGLFRQGSLLARARNKMRANAKARLARKRDASL